MGIPLLLLLLRSLQFHAPVGSCFRIVLLFALLLYSYTRLLVIGLQLLSLAPVPACSGPVSAASSLDPSLALRGFSCSGLICCAPATILAVSAAHAVLLSNGLSPPSPLLLYLTCSLALVIGLLRCDRIGRRDGSDLVSAACSNLVNAPVGCLEWGCSLG